jgi:hypothetical protein
MATREISPAELASTATTVTAAVAVVEPEAQAAAFHARSQRHALFRDHMDQCPACSQQHNEMCAVGYQLLRACLE